MLVKDEWVIQNPFVFVFFSVLIFYSPIDFSICIYALSGKEISKTSKQSFFSSSANNNDNKIICINHHWRHNTYHTTHHLFSFGFICSLCCSMAIALLYNVYIYILYYILCFVMANKQANEQLIWWCLIDLVRRVCEQTIRQ